MTPRPKLDLARICLDYCDRPESDCRFMDTLPPGWCAYACAVETLRAERVKLAGGRRRRQTQQDFTPA